VAAVTPESRTFDPAGLLRELDGRYADVRQEIRAVMRRPEFAPVVALPTAEYRQRVLEWARALAAEGLTAPGLPERYGGRGDPGANVAGFESVAFGDLSLLVKFGVHVRVPREALLNRYGDVDADGVYSSPIESAGRRFVTMLGTLVQGRVCISGASVSAAKTALTIAVRYGLRRRQFGPEPGHEVPIPDYRFTTFEGDNTVLMMLLANGLLTDYAADFGELNPVGTVTFVAGQAVETVIERLFARQIVQVIGDFVSRGDDDDLLAPDDQLDLFRWREGHITASAAQRFKRGLDDGHELKLLCDLYTLADLESDRAFFMEHGRLAGPRCKALTREVNRLCNEARLGAGALVDAFGIPDEVIGAPIGLSDAGAAAD
jgi:acyl-CoA oxidase-like protein